MASFMDNIKANREERKRERQVEKIEQMQGNMVTNPGFAGRLADVLIWLFLALIMFVSVIPLWHTIVCSLSDGKLLLAHAGLLVKPLTTAEEGLVNWGGYALIFRDSSVLSGYMNSAIYVVGGTLLGLLMNIVAGYILSRETRWKSAMILFFLFTTMFNGGTVPTYMVIRSLGMTGTRWALIIPGATNAMFMILMMNTFAAVDKSYVEAAEIDGAGHIDIMFKVMYPQCKGMALVTAINTAIMKWNEWFSASIYVPTQKQYWPLQLWVKQLTANNMDFLKSVNPDYNNYLIQYAVVIAATAPILILLPFFIGKLEKGMVLGGVKG